MATIHKTAIVDPRAVLGEGVSVGPFSIIKANAVIGDHTQIASSVVVESDVTVGRECQIFTGAIIGSVTQDLKYQGRRAYLRIGDRNRIREYVTINLGTDEHTETIIGHDNLLMAYVHIGHNSIVCNKTILANGATLAGHVTIEDGAVVGGLSAVHQFVRIGKCAIIGGRSKVVQDVIPYVKADGHPVKLFGLNTVNLQRRKVSTDVQNKLKKTYKILFRSKLSLQEATVHIKKELSGCTEVQDILSFIEKSERGICR